MLSRSIIALQKNISHVIVIGWNSIGPQNIFVEPCHLSSLIFICLFLFGFISILK